MLSQPSLANRPDDSEYEVHWVEKRGCCPVGLICNDSSGCVPPPGVPFSQPCPASWIRCPSSLGGGCCRDGQMCGLGVCYNNTPKTYQVSQTVTTTDSRGHTTTTVVTSTAVITEGPNTSAGSPTNVEVPQLILSTVAKMASVETSDSSAAAGGLSSGALGGIVTGVIVILIVIVVAATLIILRLRRAEKAAKDAAERAEDSKRDSSRSPPHSHKSGFGHPAVSEIDSSTDVDPLQRFPIMTPSSHMRSRSGTAGTDDRSLSHAAHFASSDTSSPPLWGMPFNYAPSIASDGRQSSLDSYPRNDNGPVRMPQRVSMESQGTYGHGRQPSDTSELEGPHGISEIYTTENNGAEAQRRSNSITRPGKHVRRNSDLSGQNRARGDSNAGALRTVNEIFELHGHYGPAHTAAGQTAASLNRGSSATPSPQDT
ncbi:hypothetical protein NUW58_g5849 [Xylaria curta]|uniref:Uncharacterized protein n=1 Tax=Xylaria curta TaxID=42375 RepID=A0ACC1P2N9_9PEZI|nr:hypothetical protein NUW58_g5849 [Xylaria curta]